MSNRDLIKIVARGDLSREQLDFILRQLGALGLSTEVEIIKSASELPPVPLELPYHLDGINSHEQYLVREHLTEFREKFARGVTEQKCRLLFGILGGSSQVRYRTRPNPLPESLGLVVVQRAEIGMPKLKSPQEVATAVQVGSVIEFADRAQRSEIPVAIRGLSGDTLALLVLLSEKLKEQLADPIVE